MYAGILSQVVEVQWTPAEPITASLHDSMIWLKVHKTLQVAKGLADCGAGPEMSEGQKA